MNAELPSSQYRTEAVASFPVAEHTVQQFVVGPPIPAAGEQHISDMVITKQIIATQSNEAGMPETQVVQAAHTDTQNQKAPDGSVVLNDAEIQEELARCPVEKVDALRLYFADVKRIPTYEKEELRRRNIELLERVVRDRVLYTEIVHKQKKKMAKLTPDGIEARNEILTINQNLVISRARKYQYHGYPLIDLINAGNEGFIRGIELFQLGAQELSTYAVIRIDREILMEMKRNNRSIRISTDAIAWVQQVEQGRSLLEQQLGEAPSDLQMADYLGMELKVYRRKKLTIPREISLQSPVGKDGDEFSDIIADQKQDLSRGLDKKRKTAYVQTLLASLSPREEKIMRIRYGFYDGETHTQKETAQILGVSKMRISQIENEIREKLHTNKA